MSASWPVRPVAAGSVGGPATYQYLFNRVAWAQVGISIRDALEAFNRSLRLPPTDEQVARAIEELLKIAGSE